MFLKQMDKLPPTVDPEWPQHQCTVSHIIVTSPQGGWLFFKARAWAVRGRVLRDQSPVE